MDSTQSMDVITVRGILDRYETWGIPHFQRGSVWSTGNVAALLESLYHDTPCGSLIVWERSNQDDGVPLVPGQDFSQLIIDGQQRVRSLHAAFEGHDQTFQAESAVGNLSDFGNSIEQLTGRLSWAINLNRVSEFETLLAAPAKRTHPLFVLIPDPAYTESARQKKIAAKKASLDPKRAARYTIPESQYKYNFVLLSHFNGNQFDRLLTEGRLFLKADDEQPVGQGHPVLPAVLSQFDLLGRQLDAMKDRRLFLKVLGSHVPLDEAVQIFIRINSGGRPVQEEERAFSILVESSEETSPAVKRIFSAVHGAAQERKSPHETLEHDEALARMNERSFGFKLFIRVFILAVTYHTGRSVGASSLSFGVLRDRRFLAILENKNDLYKTLWDVTAAAVLAMRHLLRTQLKLDSLQFLPDSMSLVPLFLLLIKYSGLIEDAGTDKAHITADYQPGIAQLAFLMLLRDPTGQQIMKWANTIMESEGDAGTVIDRLMQDSALDRKQLTNKLASANSLTNRYVLLLYALERRTEARDFSYRENGLVGDDFGVSERVVGEDADPEKQHLIPYSLLAGAYDLTSPSRASTSEINNIGNITYISRVENSWEGLSDRLLKLKTEDPSNLSAHFIDGKALAVYERIRKLDERDQAAGRPLKKKYERWIQYRQRALLEGFVKWAEDLRSDWDKTQAQLSQKGRSPVEPTTPLAYELTSGRALAHLIRKLNCDNQLERELVSTFAQPGWKLEDDETPADPVDALLLNFEPGRSRVVTGVALSRTALALPAIGHDAPRTVNLTDPVANLEPLQNTLGELRAFIEKKRAARSRKPG